MVDIFEERTTKDLKLLIYLKKELQKIWNGWYIWRKNYKGFEMVDIFEERTAKDLKWLIYLMKEQQKIWIVDISKKELKRI